MLEQQTVRTLFDNFKLNQSVEEIIFNARILANSMLGKKSLVFSPKSIQARPLFETEQVKEKILSKSYRELGINKSTLWYQRRRLEVTGSIRTYSKTKHYFV